MANFDQSLAVFFLFFIFWCVISVNCGRFYQITHRNQHLYHHREQNQIFDLIFIKKCAKTRSEHILRNISKSRIKITPKVLSGARNDLETPSLDQRYLVEYLGGYRGIFKNYDFLAYFRPLQAKK